MRTAWIRNEIVDAFRRAIRAGTIDYNILKTYDFQQFAIEVERYRNKELKWHHVDLKKGEIMLWVGKQGSSARRKRAPLHPEVVKIFAKWKDVDNFERPIPHAYRWLWNKMNEVKQITGLNFTNHDLRRLKAQLTEKKTHDAKAAAYSIGDKSVEMVKGHYAPTSMSTLRHLNDEAFSQLTTELEGNA